MDMFRFSPELFETRTQVQEQLMAAGFEWLTEFMSVDVLHDQYGIEVCGIPHEQDADGILRLLKRMFPCWRYVHRYYRDYGRQIGWHVAVCRDPDDRHGNAWLFPQ